MEAQESMHLMRGPFIKEPLFTARQRVRLILAVVLVMLTAGTAALRSELHDSDQAFGLKAQTISLHVAQRLAEGYTLMSAMHGLYHANSSVAEAQFPSVVARFVDAHPQVGWIAFGERVDQGDEANFQKRMHRDGFIGLRVHALPGGDASRPTELRLPVHRVEPLTPSHARLLGADLMSLPEARVAVHDAVDSGAIRATVLSIGQMQLQGILLLRAVYRGHVEPTDTLSRRQQLAGMLMLFLDAPSLIAPPADADPELSTRLLAGLHNRNHPLAEKVPELPGPATMHSHRSVFPMSVANLHLPLEVSGPVHPDLTVVAAALVVALLFCVSVLHGLRLKRSARREEKRAFVQAQLAQVTLHSIGEAVVRLDGGGRVRYMNPVAERMSGMRSVAAEGSPVENVLRLESDRRLTADTIHQLGGGSNKLVLHGADGRSKAVSCTVSRIDDDQGDAAGQVLVLRDVSREDELSRELAYQASHDPLTDLPNRREFERLLARAIVDAHDESRQHTVFYVDLDQFKLVNDTCGHAAGDRMLRQIAGILAAEVRDGDMLARLGGDEFGVLMVDCPLERALPVAQRICEVVSGFRFVWDGRAFELGASIGVVAIDADSGTVDEVQRAADLACYAAKDTGRNRVHLYQREDRVISRNHSDMQWQMEIKEALAQERFVLYSQPIQSLHDDTRAVAMQELLLRMIGKDGALVPPMAFLPAAERYGLMATLDRAVIEKSFVHAARLCAADGVVNINLSGQSLTDPTLGNYILERAQELGVNPLNVCFEVTETAAISNLAVANQLMEGLRKKGFRFALDDFGAGLSSFGYLKQLPVDFIKIDGQFIREVGTDPVARAMVASIVNVARVLELETVAEKVENGEAEELLRRMGVDYVQGFHLGRPKPIRQLPESADQLARTA